MASFFSLPKKRDESASTVVIAHRQIESILRPNLRAGQAAKGVAEWILDVAARTSPDWRPDRAATQALGRPLPFPSLLLVLLFFAIVGLRIVSSLLGGEAWSGGHHRGGRSRGSFGRGGFGGGGFGGGGASSGW